MSRPEAHIDLTTDDLLYLVAEVGAARPVGLDQIPDPEPPPEVKEWLRGATQRNLRARGILDDEGRSNPAIAEIVATTGSPGLIVNVSTQRGTVIETSVVAAVPNLAVVHTPLAPGVHRLTPIATVDVGHRVARLADLDTASAECADQVSSRNDTDSTEIVVDVASLEAVTAAAEESPAAATATAVEAGLSTDTAERLAGLVTRREATQLVTVMHRSPELHMGVVSWWHAGASGHWLVSSVPGEDGDRMVLRPTTAQQLLAEVRAHFPGVLSSSL